MRLTADFRDGRRRSLVSVSFDQSGTNSVQKWKMNTGVMGAEPSAPLADPPHHLFHDGRLYFYSTSQWTDTLPAFWIVGTLYDVFKDKQNELKGIRWLKCCNGKYNKYDLITDKQVFPASSIRSIWDLLVLSSCGIQDPLKPAPCFHIWLQSGLHRMHPFLCPAMTAEAETQTLIADFLSVISVWWDLFTLESSLHDDIPITSSRPLLRSFVPS